MSGSRFLAKFSLLLICLIAIIGCNGKVCLDIADITPGQQAAEISYNDVIFKAAIMSSGSVSELRADQSDGRGYIFVPNTESNIGSGKYASINFPSGVFDDGPKEVIVTCRHGYSCRMEAYDIDNNLVMGVEHTAGEGFQELIMNGGRISRIDLIGAEILIAEVCYRK